MYHEDDINADCPELANNSTRSAITAMVSRRRRRAS
jgi:hypothetical protein